MAGLLDLPNEVILIIVYYLYTQSDEKGVLLPFFQLGDAYRYAFEQNQPRKLKDLHSLLLTSRQLKPLLEPILYNEIFIRVRGSRNEKLPFEQLQWRLENDVSFKDHVVSAMIPCGDCRSESAMYDAMPFFWLPYLNSLTIYRFNDWMPLEFEDDSHVGTSGVENLTLIDCGAHEEALASVLSWPKALKVLFYDAEQGEWGGHYEGQEQKEWTCEAFVRTLQPQKETLEELVMVRPPLVHEGLFDGPGIHLNDFSALKILRIYHVFLCDWDDPDGVPRRLPPNLEVLEVWYDDTDLEQFFGDNEENLPYDRFLNRLVRAKRSRLPKLHKVTIFTDERIWHSDDDEEYDYYAEQVGVLWELPPSLAALADQAGIDLNVWIQCPHSATLEKADVFRSLEISQNGHAGIPS